MPQDGDGEIVVRNIATGIEWRAPRGYRPPVPPPDDPGANIAEFQAEQARLLRPVFTADSRFLVFGTEPTKAEMNKAKKEKKKPEDMPKNGLGIMDLSNGTVTRVERVKNFHVPEDGSGFIAYLMEAKAGREASSCVQRSGEHQPNQQDRKRRRSRLTTRSRALRGIAAPPREARKKNTEPISSCATLRRRTNASFSDVLDFTISKDAKTLVFTTSSKKEETNGVYAVTTDRPMAPPVTLAQRQRKISTTHLG